MKTFWAVFFGILAAVAVIPLVVAGLRIGSQIANAPSRIGANERSAVGAMRTINTAEITYASTYNDSYSADLASLGPGSGEVPAASCAGLIDEILASGKKSGYLFQYVPGPADRRHRIRTYTVVARPESHGKTGLKSFFVDETGVIRETSKDRAPTANDPPLIG